MIINTIDKDPTEKYPTDKDPTDKDPTEKDPTPPTTTLAATAVPALLGGARATQEGLGLAQCDPSKTAQHWLLSPGVSAGDSATTNIITAANNTKSGKPDCIEIYACATKEGAHVGASSGCKKVPLTSCDANPCNCNGAWSFNKNGTISSVMDGQCLQHAAGSLNVGACTGSPNQKFDATPATDANGNAIAGSITIQQQVSATLSLCIDNEAVPPGPSPGPGPTPGIPSTVTLQLADLGLNISGAVRVRDVWNKTDLPSVPSASTGSITAIVPHHGSVFLVLMPEGSKWPLPFELAPWMRKPAPPSPSS
jgi:hypothetical protein